MTEVCEISDIFVANDKFSALRSKVISLGELNALPIICLEKNTSTRKSIDRFLKSNGTALSPEFELGTSELIVKFAERGLGVGFVMSGFAKEAVDSGRLFCIKTEMPIPARKICVAVSAGRPVSVTASRLLELINKDRKI